jgi:RNA polymerase sigma-70 factor (ECF subfamily)
MATRFTNNDEDISKLERIAAGEAVAVQECIRDFGKAVWSLALRLSPTHADAEDATQEIFLDLWKSASRFDPSKGSELGFIMTIARRRLIDRIRRTKARPITEPEEFLPASEALVAQTASPELSAEVSMAVRALDELSVEQRRVISMSVFQGLTHREIAEITGKPLGTVKTLIRRGLIQIRRDLSHPTMMAAQSGLA